MLGNLTIQTDDDFSVSYKGKVYGSYDFNIIIERIEDFDLIEILGRFGLPRDKYTKAFELERDLKKIKSNPDEMLDTTGGNRGVCWWPTENKKDNSKMRVLITSGGTKIPIDSVRSITNMSKGTFGSKIARAFLSEGHHVAFLTAEGGRTPMKMEIDFQYGPVDFNKILNELLWSQEWLHNYEEYTYSTFDDYHRDLRDLVKYSKFDAIILACAASDYEVENRIQGKARSSEQMGIALKPLPKLISKIRSEWDYGGILVGFKLLVGATDIELTEAARKSVIENKCDFVVANDLVHIRDGNHKIKLVFNDSAYDASKEDAIREILANVRNIARKR